MFLGLHWTFEKTP